MPGNTSPLWSAVKKAKDVNTNELPNKIYLEGVEVKCEELADKFATFFSNKIDKILETVEIDDQVYNGERKVNCEAKMFMDPDSIRECILSLKVKKHRRLRQNPAENTG